MKNYIITSGQLTAQGNLTGYTSKGIRIHVFARQLNALGLTKDSLEKTPISPSNPLFCIADEKSYNAKKDDQGNPIPFEDGSTTMVRLTALSIFQKKEQLISAHAEESLLDAEITHEINTLATARGLTSDAVAQMANASI